MLSVWQIWTTIHQSYSDIVTDFSCLVIAIDYLHETLRLLQAESQESMVFLSFWGKPCHKLDCVWYAVTDMTNVVEKQ